MTTNRSCFPQESQRNATIFPSGDQCSVIAWHGNTWHGAFPKKTDGLRLNVTTYMCHRRVKTQEHYKRGVTEEMLDRNPPEFARLVGQDDMMGWDENGPDIMRMLKYMSPEVKERYAKMAAAR